MSILRRTERARKSVPSRMIGYDLETSRIAAGTPTPLYITAFSDDPHFSLDTPIRDYAHFLRIIETQLLVPEHYGVKFVAWHGNNFDGYFMAACLLQTREYIIRPYLTRNKSLRGLKIIPREFGADTKTKNYWEILDGAAMLGLPGLKLEDFLKNFAPELPKMSGVIDFEKEEFDSNNKQHCEYAYRDSVGLYVAMKRAQQILLDTFDQPLAVTMGGACIKIFMAHIPRGVEVISPPAEVVEIIRSHVMRGGYCYCVGRYQGPCWKYDINQAYAHAMRSAMLPCGFIVPTHGKPPANVKVFIAKISARHRTNKVPFYYRTLVNGKIKSAFSVDVITETWLTSIETNQLVAEGWSIVWHAAWSWSAVFNMREYVDKLETLRRTSEGGPSGPKGQMVKGVGNHSYGKTVEALEPIDYTIALECPDGYAPYYDDDIDPVEHVYYRFISEDDQRPKPYHQPQIGAFITAEVRMQMRRVILKRPDAWRYSDTDCVVFSEDMTKELDIDPARYGAWKIEESGSEIQIIAKKVYRLVTAPGAKKKRSAKGMNVKKLSDEDFDEWYDGTPPEQNQVQRQNFLKVMQGAEMFRGQKRKGTKV